VVIDDFTTGRGHFTSPVDAGPATGGFFPATSSVAHDAAVGHAASGSLRLTIDDDPDINFRALDPWRLNLLSGAGLPANNISLPATGFVGYWLRTTQPDISASIVVNDGTGTEQGLLRPVIPDGQWHLYEWDLGARSPGADWLNFSGGNALIDHPTVTIYAIQLWTRPVAREMDATLWIDDVTHNPSGSIVPEPAHAALLGLTLLLGRRRSWVRRLAKTGG
jgi:hypothetical protein